MVATSVKVESAADGARHCLSGLPYRMVVFARYEQPSGTPLYLVAGSNLAARGARKALKLAHDIHGGCCFYCQRDVPRGEMTIDHVEPGKFHGRDSLQNMLVSCRPCNLEKGKQPIEAFRPEAGREWLGALLRQVQGRLNRL